MTRVGVEELNQRQAICARNKGENAALSSGTEPSACEAVLPLKSNAAIARGTSEKDF
jgi:hypothetical protein